VVARHPKLVRLRHFIPALFVASLVLCALLCLVSPWFALLLAIIAGCYVLVSILASVLIAAREGWRYLPLLPAAFACLHFSYGAGFLLGVGRFLIQRVTRPQSGAGDE
jgi:hypothetical protein